ncbi:MAG: hypothetical protein ACRDQH_15410, partial [Pseudonocardiaceae bacterium]
RSTGRVADQPAQDHALTRLVHDAVLSQRAEERATLASNPKAVRTRCMSIGAGRRWASSRVREATGRTPFHPWRLPDELPDPIHHSQFLPGARQRQQWMT